MATQRDILKNLIATMKEESQETRSGSPDSLMTVREAIQNNGTKIDTLVEGPTRTGGAVESVTSSGDDIEAMREQKAFNEKMLETLQEIATNTGGLKGVSGGAPATSGGLLSDAGDLLGGLGKGLGGAALGIGGGIGLAGLGVGAAAGGIGFAIGQIAELNKSFDDLARGMRMLNETDINTEQFTKLGQAIASLTSGAGIGGAIGLRILQGTAFEDLSKGLETLNATEFNPDALDNVTKAIGNLTGESGVLSSAGFALLSATDFEGIADGLSALGQITVNPEQMKLIGEGIDALISPLSSADVGEAGVLQMIDDNLLPIAEGAAKINGLGIDGAFVERMGFLGEGLDALLSPLSGGDVGEATVLQMIDDNLPALADGANAINYVNAELFKSQATLLGQGFQSLLDGLDDLLGATGIEMVDDNIIPIADAAKYFTDIVTPEVATSFKTQATALGGGFQALLDGTDDLLGTTGLQSIDDNIIPVANAVKYFTDVVTPEVANSFRTVGPLIGAGFQALLDGTDDLLGTTGLQGIDDNLVPLADGVEKLNDIGSRVDLQNFFNIRDAVTEIRGIVGDIGSIQFTDLAEGDMGIRALADKVADMRSLALGMAQGGEQEFNSLGFMGLGNSIDFGTGLLDPQMKLDELRASIGKIQEVAGGVLGQVKIDAPDMQTTIAERPEKTPREILRTYFTDMQNENADTKAKQQAQALNVVNAPNVSTTNNNSSTAAIIDKNMPTVDYNDRTYPIVYADW